MFLTKEKHFSGEKTSFAISWLLLGTDTNRYFTINVCRRSCRFPALRYVSGQRVEKFLFFFLLGPYRVFLCFRG